MAAGRRPRIQLRSGQLPGKLIDELLDYAESFFFLSQPVGDKGTLEAHYEQYYKTIGKEPPREKELGECPHSLAYLWEIFRRLARKRSYIAITLPQEQHITVKLHPLPLTHTEILAWSQLTSIELEYWELDVIDELDSLQLHSFSKKDRDEDD